MGNANPVLLGYQSLRLDSSPDAAENGRRILAAYAQREGYTLGLIFTDVAYGRMVAFDALLNAVRAGGVAAVGVPTIDDLSSMPRMREAMRLRLEHAGGVRVVVAQTAVDGALSLPPGAEGRS
jgi:hypothetical protein